MIKPILQVRKLSQREVKQLTARHAVYKEQGWNKDSGTLAAESAPCYPTLP